MFHPRATQLKAAEPRDEWVIFTVDLQCVLNAYLIHIYTDVYITIQSYQANGAAERSWWTCQLLSAVSLCVKHSSEGD